MDPEAISPEDNQSRFSSDQELLQAPPELKVAPHTSRKKWYLVFGGGVLVIVMFVWFLRPSPQGSTTTELPPTPTPIPELSPLQKEFVALEEQMQAADPSDDFDALPPIDMSISF